MKNRKSIRVTIPADSAGAFDKAKKRAEDAAMCKMTDTQYASRLLAWAASVDQDGDRSKKHEAMMHLEFCFPKEMDQEAQARVCAAHYLMQSMVGGYEPDNYAEVLAEAREFDRPHMDTAFWNPSDG